MNKSVLSLLLALSIAFDFTSCSTKQGAISKLEKFSFELRDNAQYYTLNDWEKAAEDFSKIRKRISRHNYTPDERQRIGELEGKCISYAYQGVKGRITGLGNELNGILQGLIYNINK